jgi:hypothetical protein
MKLIEYNKFFKTTAKSFKFFDRAIASEYPHVSKKGTGVIDIHSSFDWKNPGDVSEVPVLRAIEKELIYGSYTTSILTFIEQLGNLSKGLQGSGNGTDIYPQLYATKDTGFKYYFPHLLTSGSNLNTIQNNWAAITNGPQSMVNQYSDGKSSKGSGFGEKFIEMGVGFSMGMLTPGFGFDDMYNFQNTQLRTIPVSFPLYNTLSIKSAYDNFCFVQLFMMQNLKTRTSLATYIPPKLYQVDQIDSQGGFCAPICIVSNYSVESIGTTRRMTEFKDYGAPDILMPEAYKITINFMELVQNSSNIYSGAIGGDKVTVMNGSRVLGGSGNQRNTGDGMPSSTPGSNNTNGDNLPNITAPLVQVPNDQLQTDAQNAYNETGSTRSISGNSNNPAITNFSATKTSESTNQPLPPMSPEQKAMHDEAMSAFYKK